MDLKIIKDTSFLKKKCIKIPKIDDNFRILIKEMFQLMGQHKGYGLAANQVGLMERFFIINHQGRKYVCVDPKILAIGKQVYTASEGCLSYPGEYVFVERPMDIKVEFTTELNIKRSARFHDYTARVFLHEIDHLDGITMHDREIAGIA